MKQLRRIVLVIGVGLVLAPAAAAETVSVDLTAKREIVKIAPG